MGFRFKKSVKLGKGFRLNFSKKGVGGSLGWKGLRLTKKSGGGLRTTASVPGSGFSYSKDYGSRPPRKRSCSSIWSIYQGNYGCAWWIFIGSWLWIFLLYIWLIITIVSLLFQLLKIAFTAIYKAIRSKYNKSHSDQEEDMAYNNIGQEQHHIKQSKQDYIIAAIIALLITILIVTAVATARGCYGTESPVESSTPESSSLESSTPDHEPEEIITGFYFSSLAALDIQMEVDDTLHGHFDVEGVSEADSSDIVLISTNESAVRFEIEKTQDSSVYYVITSLAGGSATLRVETTDGTIVSENIIVTVLTPEQPQDPPKVESTPASTTAPEPETDPETSHESDPETPAETPTQTEPTSPKYYFVGNKNSKIFHYSYCASVKRMNETNKDMQNTTREDMISQGYSPCEKCKP